MAACAPTEMSAQMAHAFPVRSWTARSPILAFRARAIRRSGARRPCSTRPATTQTSAPPMTPVSLETARAPSSSAMMRTHAPPTSAMRSRGVRRALIRTHAMTGTRAPWRTPVPVPSVSLGRRTPTAVRPPRPVKTATPARRLGAMTTGSATSRPSTAMTVSIARWTSAMAERAPVSLPASLAPISC